MEQVQATFPANFIPLCRQQTEEMRNSIFGRVEVEQATKRVIRSSDAQYTLFWKKTRFRNIDFIDPEIKERRWQCSIFSLNGERIAAADVIEISVSVEMSDRDWVGWMDGVSQQDELIASTFIKGWAAADLYHCGNLAVLTHVAAKKGVGPTVWAPLLNKFIERVIFKDAFVLIADVFPYDTARALRKAMGDRLRDLDGNFKINSRLDTKLKFFAKHLSLKAFEENEERPSWMYRLPMGAEEEYAPYFWSADNDQSDL